MRFDGQYGYGLVCSPKSRNYDPGSICPSSYVIGEELRVEALLETSHLGFGFEGLDFVTNAMVRPAARPFGFRSSRADGGPQVLLHARAIATPWLPAKSARVSNGAVE